MSAEPKIIALTPTVTLDQLELVRKTIAPTATEDELKLFLYDCQRRGVHPLDRLVHFTKRGGRYTPIAGIDYLRSRASDTGSHIGTTDAEFGPVLDGGCPEWARVTVSRLVADHVATFTATARWKEYYPGQGSEGFMWRKMPYTMLAKVAESLALRKGFPAELAGLYERSEMDQADRPAGMSAEDAATARQLNEEGAPMFGKPLQIPADAPMEDVGEAPDPQIPEAWAPHVDPSAKPKAGNKGPFKPTKTFFGVLRKIVEQGKLPGHYLHDSEQGKMARRMLLSNFLKMDVKEYDQLTYEDWKEAISQLEKFVPTAETP